MLWASFACGDGGSIDDRSFTPSSEMRRMPPDADTADAWARAAPGQVVRQGAASPAARASMASGRRLHGGEQRAVATRLFYAKDCASCKEREWLKLMT